ncbi:DUF1702 family protein [Nocardia asteroides]|uniref:DUF1702 family protein n=1 Tax=Nocardia asteroides TaxID=1824 RepID=UPI001E5FCF51|nr:DUF1702 family protein [Nocardia asteroides]UGT62331.1 DUF1702 family protein [Nocardia asteroides]
MITALGVARHLVPAPSMKDMLFHTRRFPVTAGPLARRYEGVPRAVLEGFEYGADIADPAEIAERLEWIDPLYRSLACEGAVAALAIRDLMSPRKQSRAIEFTRGPGAPHAMLAYIGFGLVLSRLPRPLWRRALPRLEQAEPLLAHLSWLAVDGYGFDLAFFDPERWIVRREPAPRYRWEGRTDYFDRAFDQGIGRAVAFYHAGDYDAAAATVRTFAPERRADLWSGVGTVACYLGGIDRAALLRLLAAAGPHLPDLAIGVVMAAEARQHAGFVPENTELASEVVCGANAATVAALAVQTAQAPPAPEGPPAYEQWRLRIRANFAERVAVAP